MCKYKAIIFDMDGVLFDTELFYYKRRERFLKQHGITIDHLPMNFFYWRKYEAGLEICFR